MPTCVEQEEEIVLIFEYILYLKPGRSECSNRINSANFYSALFYNYYGSVLLIFQAMTTGQVMDGRRTDVGKHCMCVS